MQLIDSHGRRLDYVRLAVIDRCNLRCHYCMPVHGIDFVKRSDLLSYEEMLRLLKIFKNLGVTKLRITGGEPLLRKDLLGFLDEVTSQEIFSGYHLTTNATLTEPHIDRLIDSGLRSVNISLDTLNQQRFKEITHRDSFDSVMSSLQQFLDRDVAVKLNMVVMKHVHEEDIIPMAALARHSKVSVRFLEEMPFDGKDEVKPSFFTHHDILDKLKKGIGPLTQLPYKSGETSTNYVAEGWKGELGIIASYSRTFCGTCNRLRITPTGKLKTCLYSKNDLDLRQLLRDGSSDAEIAVAIQNAVSRKHINGVEAERDRDHHINESMASIGG